MSSDRPSGPTTKKVRLGERTMLACIHCKQKKLKCDGQTPKCQNCVRTNRDCLVEDPATGLHRPRDYLKSLETRVAYLELLLQQTRPEVALDHLDDTEGAHVGPRQTHGTAEFLNLDHASPGDGDESIDDLSTEVALLCLSAAGSEPHYFGPSCAVSFSRIVSATMGLPKRGGSSQHGGALPDTHAPEVERTFSVSFPSRNLATTLTQAYFKNIHPQYPFLHKPTFLAWEDKCTRASLAGDLDSAGDLPLFFVLMACYSLYRVDFWLIWNQVYAIGSLALGPAHRDSAEAYYSKALDHQASVLDRDGLESIQSILCCAVYSIRSPVGVSVW